MKTVVYGMLDEEKKRNLEMQRLHRQEIEALRKGSIVIKNRPSGKYYYLKYWKDGKTKTDYIGKDEMSIEKINQEIKKRKYLQGVLKRLKVEYQQISKIVKD